MAITTAAGIAYNTVTNETSAGADDADQLAPLGFELVRTDANGAEQVWVYVKASGEITTGDVLQLIDGASTLEVVRHPTALAVNDTAIRVMGVAQHDIGDNGFGFIMKKGFGSLRAGSGGITVNTSVTPAGAGTAGRGLDFAAGTTSAACVIAFCTVAAGANAQSTCYINCT